MNAEMKKRMHELAAKIADRAGVTAEEVLRNYRRACRGGAVNMATLFVAGGAR